MNKKISVKLIAVVFALLLSVTVAVASSYAWMVLSTNPAVSGIQVSIGGGNTVLIAPDIRETAADGTVYHYPGHFSDKMNFHQQESYGYLQELGNLNPVSTVNGVDWILPVYYTRNDAKVQQGKVTAGSLKDVADFKIDSELTFANLSAEEEEQIEKGHYIYLDFWVVSPASNYKLRVSTGVEELDGGSFVVDLPQPAEQADAQNGYTLQTPSGSPASAVRIGFLANDLIMTDDTMTKYTKSTYFDDRYLHLKGLYQEPNTGTAYIEDNRFTIYEPNGDAHPTRTDLEGLYVETKPLGLRNGEIVEAEIRDVKNTFLTVQRQSLWKVLENGQTLGEGIESVSVDTVLEQRFQTALYSGDWSSLSLEEVSDKFYRQYLQGQIAPYVAKGAFAQRTENMYALMNKGQVSLEEPEIGAAGATDDAIIIELEKNAPQRIRMFLWLEGQDVDCVAQIAASGFAVNIELACGDE